MKNNSSISIRDVAERAGVSIATVSRVMNKKPYISEDVRQRVLAAIDELGYQPSRVARALKTATTNIIGLVISGLASNNLFRLVEAIEEVVYQKNHVLFLCNSNQDPEREAYFISLLEAENVAGIIIDSVLDNGEAAEQYSDLDIPLVAINRQLENLGVDYVAIKNLQGVLDAVQHLINDGHKVVGGLFGSLKTSTHLERYQGFRRAAALNRNNGFSFHAETDLLSENDAYRALNKMLDLPNPPTAVFTDNSEIAQGVLRAAKAREIHVPNELGLISFGDMDFFQIFKPPISVVSIPVEPLGRRAAKLLFERMQNPNNSRSKVELQANLIIRQSCSRRHQE